MKEIKTMFKFWIAVSTLLCTTSLMAEEVTVVGTGDGVTVLKAIGAAYSKINPNIIVSVPKSIGSGGGVKTVGNGEFQLGRVARGIKSKEEHFNLSYVAYAKVPVVYFVNPSVAVDNLSADQVLAIYSGKIKNWKEVGGNNMKVRVVRREDGDSSLSQLKKSFPGFKDLVITEKSKTVFSTPDVVKILESKKGTIGFGPYDVVSNRNVKVLKINGLLPTAPNYPSVTTLGFVFNDKAISDLARGFMMFATSADAQAAITTAGGVSL